MFDRNNVFVRGMLGLFVLACACCAAAGQTQFYGPTVRYSNPIKPPSGARSPSANPLTRHRMDAWRPGAFPTTQIPPGPSDVVAQAPYQQTAVGTPVPSSTQSGSQAFTARPPQNTWQGGIISPAYAGQSNAQQSEQPSWAPPSYNSGSGQYPAYSGPSHHSGSGQSNKSQPPHGGQASAQTEQNFWIPPAYAGPYRKSKSQQSPKRTDDDGN